MFRTDPLQALHHCYGLLRPCARYWYSFPQDHRLNVSLYTRTTGSRVPCRSLCHGRAASMPDVIQPVIR